MSNREMNLDVILPVWNDTSKSNEQITTELRFPSFQVLRTKVTRCPRKAEFISRTAAFVPTGAPATAPAATAAPAAVAPATAPAAATGETSVEDLVEPDIRVAIIYDTVIDGTITERNQVLRGKASEPEKFTEALESLKGKYSLGQGDWLNPMNQPPQAYTDGLILRFKPQVRAGVAQA